ncbi:MAG: transcription-repair coupling factor [Candidatus Omnitrophica bacterium]|nr:transcription-repair coupling factor [Candidatus Omnitrophota bacterium]
MFRTLKFYLNQTINTHQTFEQFINFGYEQVDAISQKGNFAHRGSIIDVYPINYESPVRIELAFNEIEKMFTFSRTTGKKISNQSPLIILPKRSAVHTIEIERLSINKFEELEKNDFIVHLDHGIGKYLGITTLKNVKHIKIEYADNDKLYIPLTEKHLLQKYIGFAGHAPRLHKLGGKLWQSTKNKTKQGITSYALELLRLQAKRNSLSGLAFSSKTLWQKEFEKSFPYTETPDQKKSWLETKKDMEMPRPMDRLLCGDVGYGKTEIAFRAAFKAVMNNRQVAMLVPTTILAEQHYHNLKERVKDFPVNVQMLSRFKTASEQDKIIEDLAKGAVDIVIGTHRLLSDDIHFKELGIIIIDEEQRFGVKAKEKLKHIREIVDVLTLTATPIPRTLYMSLLGVKDMSTINTPPEQRMPIETFVCLYDDELVKNAINNELEREGQVFFIHNRIKDIHKILEHLKSLVPSARIAIGHGQMHEKELEKVMLDFIEHKIDVLLSTTIVESGLDIPNANTLIVNNAQNFGLADLYQLRGRVGRLNKKAYSFFLTPKHATFNPQAKKRLKSIQKFTALGSGFKIAMEDLEIRGAGNLLGEQQHGFILAVGFDLYCQLLSNAIEQIKKAIPNNLP